MNWILLLFVARLDGTHHYCSGFTDNGAIYKCKANTFDISGGKSTSINAEGTYIGNSGNKQS